MTGIFILSLDTEIAWGTDAAYLPRYAHCFDDYPTILRRLIALLDEYNIPTTWAIVGQLMLPETDERASRKQPTNWYHAPYVLDWIRAAKTPHEIGTHTFSHIYTDEADTSQTVWEADLANCLKLHQQFSLPLRSIVYPRNQIRYLDTLAKYGIIAYRGVEGNRPRERRGVTHLLHRALALPPPTYDLRSCKVSDNLVNLPASQFLLAYDGIRGRIPTASRVREAHIGIKQAAVKNELYHLWFHPFNLGTSPRMFDALEQILQFAGLMREQGKIQVLTMEQAATEVLGYGN
ncbi:MAG: polysaccharide deacetylase family protein [Anaerolineaceae bacterium]|nr:polysaccharide deacetylase family protein [Anaerolineaceae bacterium]